MRRASPLGEAWDGHTLLPPSLPLPWGLSPRASGARARVGLAWPECRFPPFYGGAACSSRGWVRKPCVRSEHGCCLCGHQRQTPSSLPPGVAKEGPWQVSEARGGALYTPGPLSVGLHLSMSRWLLGPSALLLGPPPFIPAGRTAAHSCPSPGASRWAHLFTKPLLLNPPWTPSSE